jgi:2'-5' RNA ligase
MARLRTFVAVDLGKAIRDRAVALQETLSRAGTPVKWVEPQNLHVTLLFLGEVEDRAVAEVCRVIGEQSRQHAAFSMKIGQVGCFPHPRRPRVIWVGVGAGSQELVALHDAFEPPLLELGCYRREERKYTPHVTLGRVKSDRPTGGLSEALSRHADWQGGEILVREVLVLSSELTPDGPLYTVLSRARLAESK